VTRRGGPPGRHGSDRGGKHHGHDHDHGNGHDHGHDHHDHPHDPGHDHDHHDHSHHDHLREVSRRRLIIVLSITATFMVVEFVGGYLANSLALMADAGHMLNDVAALALTYFALWISRKPATLAKTYGYLRMEILAALVNGATLMLIAGVIFWHAAQRFRQPPEVEGTLMLVVATGGLIVNVIAALLLHSSSSHNLNMRGAYLHVLGDLLGSVGAISAAVIILLTGWYLADPLISVFVGLLILVGAWRLVRESVDILLEAVPKGIDMSALHRAILDIEGVEEVHDLHVWTLTSGFLAMSGHAVVRDPARYKEVLEAVHELMHDRFRISHVTVQVEHRTMYPLRRAGSAPPDAGPGTAGDGHARAGGTPRG
jgi:cobalt-zinc-cadmium efflux system protein